MCETRTKVDLGFVYPSSTVCLGVGMMVIKISIVHTKYVWGGTHK